MLVAPFVSVTVTDTEIVPRGSSDADAANGPSVPFTSVPEPVSVTVRVTAPALTCAVPPRRGAGPEATTDNTPVVARVQFAVPAYSVEGTSVTAPITGGPVRTVVDDETGAPAEFTVVVD